MSCFVIEIAVFRRKQWSAALLYGTHVCALLFYPWWGSEYLL